MLRIAIALTMLGAVAGCTTAPEQPLRRTAEGQAALARLLAGKSAAQPVSCVQRYHFSDMTVIDGRTVAFHWPGTAYLVQLSPGCEEIASGYPLLTTERGGIGLCTGDIARVLDTTTHFTVGSCAVDRIVPYTARR